MKNLFKKVSNKNNVIYFFHFGFVLATAYFAAKSGIASWYFVFLIGLPLVLSSIPQLSGVSYTLNVRILFPISVGLFCVAFYHYFPSILIDEGAANLARFGISNSNSGVEQDIFEVNPIFKDAVTVLYAICAAFLLWKGLSDFDELKHVLYEEASGVRSISDYTSYFLASGNPDANKEKIVQIRVNMLKYLENMLAGNKVVASQENEGVLEDTLLKVGALQAADHNDEIALEEIMKNLSRISVLRSKRTVCIEKRMSPFILVLMLLMSITMVSSFLGKASGVFNMDYVYVFLLPAFYTSIFMTLLDLSSPFDGYWSIKLEAVRGVKEKLEGQIADQA